MKESIMSLNNSIASLVYYHYNQGTCIYSPCMEATTTLVECMVASSHGRGFNTLVMSLLF